MYNEQRPEHLGEFLKEIGSKVRFTEALLQHVEVPETLLKKRKQTEKAREERLAKAAEARKVCYCSSRSLFKFFRIRNSIYDAYDSFDEWLTRKGDAAFQSTIFRD